MKVMEMIGTMTFIKLYFTVFLVTLFGGKENVFFKVLLYSI